MRTSRKLHKQGMISNSKLIRRMKLDLSSLREYQDYGISIQDLKVFSLQFSSLSRKYFKDFKGFIGNYRGHS